jgi:hypothetical protein
MINILIRLITPIILLILYTPKELNAHEGHKKKEKMPAIGVIQGSVTDSSTGAPIEYASISIVDNHDGDVVTGGI